MALNLKKPPLRGLDVTARATPWMTMADPEGLAPARLLGSLGSGRSHPTVKKTSLPLPVRLRMAVHSTPDLQCTITASRVRLTPCSEVNSSPTFWLHSFPPPQECPAPKSQNVPSFNNDSANSRCVSGIISKASRKIFAVIVM